MRAQPKLSPGYKTLSRGISARLNGREKNIKYISVWSSEFWTVRDTIDAPEKTIKFYDKIKMKRIRMQSLNIVGADLMDFEINASFV